MAGDGALERGEFDDDVTLEFFGPLEGLVAAAAGERLAAELADDLRHPVGIFLVLDGIVDFHARDPVCDHDLDLHPPAAAPPVKKKLRITTQPDRKKTQ